MIRFLTGIFVGMLITVPLAFGQKDVAGSKDYPGITRMPCYYISSYEEIAFDSFSFTVSESGNERKEPVEGRRFNFRYELKENVTVPSQLQVVRNYENAARSAGGRVLYHDDEATTFRLTKGGKEVWFSLHVANPPSGVVIDMVVIEKQAMQQDVTMDAKALAGGIGEAGSVAVYGIYFDTGKSALKPESSPALQEIVKLLRQNPTLKLYVVGHTDMVADVATNMRLSQARAQSVVNALVAQGIAGSRLIAYGDGPYAPVASNRTEEGRAKNRRVDLVEIAID